MNAKSEQVVQQYLELPEAERRAVLARILEVDAAQLQHATWLAELERRSAEADANPDSEIPAEQVFADIRAKYKRA